MVAENISFANLKAVLIKFLKEVFQLVSIFQIGIVNHIQNRAPQLICLAQNAAKKVAVLVGEPAG